MITTFKKIILSLDVVIQITIVCLLLYSFLLPKIDSSATNIVILLFAGMYNPISTVVNLLVKSQNKKIRTLRLSYLAAILIYVVLAFIFIPIDVPTETGFFGDYANIAVLNLFAFGYAIITFLDFGSIFKGLPKQKEMPN